MEKYRLHYDILLIESKDSIIIFKESLHQHHSGLQTHQNAPDKNLPYLYCHFTPCQMISAGLTCFFSNLNVADVVILVSVVILVAFFSMQRYGTDKVGWLFAPIVLVWFLFIGSIGALNIWKYDRSVLKAFNPIYIYRYFKRGKSNWTSLGGIMLSITGLFFLDPPHFSVLERICSFVCLNESLFAGTEALFADLCHFPVLAIQVCHLANRLQSSVSSFRFLFSCTWAFFSMQIAFTFVVFPCLLLAYTGQAAYIMKNQGHVVDAFYRSIPGTSSPSSIDLFQKAKVEETPQPYQSFFRNLCKLFLCYVTEPQISCKFPNDKTEWLIHRLKKVSNTNAPTNSDTHFLSKMY